MTCARGLRLVLRPRGSGAVVLVYRAWDRERCEVADVAHARALPGGAELEVVMQNPGWRRRGKVHGPEHR